MSGGLQTGGGARSERIALFGFYFAFVIVGEAALLGALCAHYRDGWLTFATGLAIACAGVALVLFVCLFDRHRTSPEHLFLVLAPVLLGGFAFFMMPYAVPDEFTHIHRLFDNRAGQEFLNVPAQLHQVYTFIGNYEQLASELAVSFDYTQLRQTDFTVAAYSEVNYLVPSLVVSAGKALGLNAYVLIYLARLSNAALFALAAWWIIRRLPSGKQFALVFLLNPMLLQQEASCSADALCNIAILCFLAQVIALRAEGRIGIPWHQWALLGFFFSLVFLCKYIYLPLTAAALVLLPQIKRRWIRWGVPFAMAGFAVFAAVFVLSSGYGRILDEASHRLAPSMFAQRFAETVQDRGIPTICQFAGENLGWPCDALYPAAAHVPLAWAAYLAVLAVALLASFDGRLSLPWHNRLLFFLLAIAEQLILFTVLLLDDLSETGPIGGFQGRYLIPTVFLGAASLFSLKRWRIGEAPVHLFAVAVLALDALSLAFVIIWFW